MKKVICIVGGILVLLMLMVNFSLAATKSSTEAKTAKKYEQRIAKKQVVKKDKPALPPAKKIVPQMAPAPMRLKIRHAKPVMPLWQRILTNSYVMMVGYPFFFFLGVLACGLYCRFPRRPNPVLQNASCEEPEEKEGILKKLFGKFRKTESSSQPA